MKARITPKAWLLGLFLIGATSCNLTESLNPNGKPKSTGALYEMVISCGTPIWNTAVGDTLKSIYGTACDYLNQYEPVMDAMRIVPTNLRNVLAKHRNILTVEVDTTLTEATSTAIRDYWASPQLIVQLKAPSNAALLEYINNNRQPLIDIFEKEELTRTLTGNKKYRQAGLGSEINEMFGINIDLPNGYRKRSTVGNDFMWVSYEYPLASQGFAIYTYPYEGREDFLMESMLARRNEFMKRIPGPSDGSYMTTQDMFPPEVKYMTINGREWAEMRSFWDIENDFMGGPAVTYSTRDVMNNRIVVIDCYVYHPDGDKRNYIRGLEAIVHSVRLAEDSAVIAD